MVEDANVASWLIAARAMGFLACGAVAVGVFSIRARERTGGYWLLGWAMLLLAGVGFVYADIGAGFGQGQRFAYLADALFAPLMLVAGVLTMGRPGENARRRSSLLMWSRIVSQAGVVVFLLLYLWLR